MPTENIELDPRDGAVGRSRLESFSDSVFALSAALLVVTLEVPRTYPELVANLSGFWSFGLSFIMLILIWAAHAGFFRRYPFCDSWVVVLNSVLLFVVLFYVYPLKFMTTAFVERFLGVGPFVDPTTGHSHMLRSVDELRGLFLLYGAGFMAVFLCLASLYLYTWYRRDRLALEPLNAFDAQTWSRHYLIYVLVGLLSIVFSHTGLGASVGLPGWIYGALGPLCAWHGISRGRQRQQLEQNLESS